MTKIGILELKLNYRTENESSKTEHLIEQNAVSKQTNVCQLLTILDGQLKGS